MAVEFRAGPQPHFILQHGARVLVIDDHRVGPLLIVFEEVHPAGRRDGFRHSVQSHDSPAVIDAVHAVVAQVTRAVVEQPPPGTADDAGVVSPLRGRALPDVVVDVRRGLAVLWQVDSSVATRFPRPAENDLPHGSAAGVLDGFLQKRRTANLRAHLHHAVLFPSRRHRRFPFEDVVTGRLLDIDVLSGQTTLDGEHRMPVIRRRHHERVDRIVCQKIAVVVDELRHAPGPLLHLGGALFTHGLADIANVSDLAIGLGSETSHDRVAATTDSDAGHTDFLTGRIRPTALTASETHSQSKSGRMLKETTTSAVRHD